MKKASLILSIAVLSAAGLTSCKKDYTCTCTTLGVPTVTRYDDVSPREARRACDKLNDNVAGIGGVCTLDMD